MLPVDGLSKTWTYFEDKWHEGNVPIMGPRTHAAWLCSLVFDGARAFEGVTPRPRTPLRACERIGEKDVPQTDGFHRNMGQSCAERD